MTRREKKPVPTKFAKTDKKFAVTELRNLAAWQENNEVQLKAGAPKGNMNRLRHGIFSNKVLEKDEVELYQAIIDALHDDFTLNRSSDVIQCELVAVNYVKLARAYAANDFENVERLDKIVRQHLKDLKATKASREGTEPAKKQTTPAEWATALLEKVTEAKEELSGQPRPEPENETADAKQSCKTQKK